MADAQNRTLPASAKKLAKARGEGQVARSRDLGHLTAVGVGTLLVIALLPQAMARLIEVLTSGLHFDAAMLQEPDALQRQLQRQGLDMLWLVLPLGLTMMVVAVASVVLCGGWNFTLKPLHPSFSKFNPLAGFGRLFSKVQLVETLKSCLLAGILLWIGSAYVRSHLDDFGALALMELSPALVNAGELIRGGVVLLLVALALFAVVDVPLQKWRLREQLKMSFEEVKEEFKQQEGNVEVKGKIKQRMRMLARSRMLAAVPAADLVVMNPTHYAVALKYEEGSMGAPRVVAKGVDLLALRIRDLATEHKVPVLQAPPLARALYAHTEIDQEIPAALFGAVAQVLAWVYQLRQATPQQAAALSAPQPAVPAELDPQNPQARRRPAGRPADRPTSRPASASESR